MDLGQGNAQIEGAEAIDFSAILSDQVFSNRIIVERISKKLNLEDLKTLRLLRHSCYDESKPVWNKRTYVRFKKTSVNGRPLADFNNFIMQSYGTKESREAKEFPFHSFSFTGWNESTQDLKTFVSLWASQIKELQIVDFCSSSHVTAKDFIETVRMLMAHTESLHIISDFDVRCKEFFTKVCSDGFSNLKELKLSLRGTAQLLILCKFPNLTKLVINDIEHTGHYWATILTMRSLSISKPNWKTPYLALTSLDVSGTVLSWQRDFEYILQANFPLQHLALNVPPLDHFDLIGILNHYGRRLITLKLLRGKVKETPPCKIIPLQINFENLNELQLEGNMEDSLEFLQYTPVLAKLKMNRLGTRVGPFPICAIHGAAHTRIDIVQNSKLLLRSRNFSVPSLLEFKSDRKLAHESYRQLGEWMPNLQICEVPTSD